MNHHAAAHADGFPPIIADAYCHPRAWQRGIRASLARAVRAGRADVAQAWRRPRGDRAAQAYRTFGDAATFRTLWIYQRLINRPTGARESWPEQRQRRERAAIAATGRRVRAITTAAHRRAVIRAAA
jgi:ABC-type phosphate/phosphonate transport system substrate-binding protein